MQSYKNLVFGSSGIIGKTLVNLLNSKETLCTSRKKPEIIKNINWKKIDLDKDNLKKLPKYVKIIYFLASPYYLEKNLKKKNYFKKELAWIKKIIKNINCEKLVFMSSSSIYSKNHQIGFYKKRIENELNNSTIKTVQIWRPFNIVGYTKNSLSDHFQNILIKQIYAKGRKKITLKGSMNDKRGYSSVIKFCKEVIKNSKYNKSFVYNYRNKNILKIKKVIEIFQNVLKENKKTSFNYRFKNLKTNKNYSYKKLGKVKTIFSKEKSDEVLYNYFNEIIRNEKKM